MTRSPGSPGSPPSTPGAAVQQHALPEAIEYAANKHDCQNAYGGPVGGADRQHGGAAYRGRVQEVRPVRGDHEAQREPAKAKQELQACGQPNGFSTGIAYRSDRPKEAAAAQALHRPAGPGRDQGLAARLPDRHYYANFAGVPKYVSSHNIGIAFYGWGARLAGRLRLLQQLADGPAIIPAGNTNLAQLNDPVVNNLLTKVAPPPTPPRGTPTWARSTSRS